MTRMVFVAHPDQPAMLEGDVIQTVAVLCDRCHQPIESSLDHVVYPPSIAGEVAEFDFRHKRCDFVADGTSFMPIRQWFVSLRLGDE